MSLEEWIARGNRCLVAHCMALQPKPVSSNTYRGVPHTMASFMVTIIMDPTTIRQYLHHFHLCESPLCSACEDRKNFGACHTAVDGTKARKGSFKENCQWKGTI